MGVVGLYFHFDLFCSFVCFCVWQVGVLWGLLLLLLFACFCSFEKSCSPKIPWKQVNQDVHSRIQSESLPRCYGFCYCELPSRGQAGGTCWPRACLSLRKSHKAKQSRCFPAEGTKSYFSPAFHHKCWSACF